MSGSALALLAGLLCVDACSYTNCVNQNIKHIQVDDEIEEIDRCNQSNVTSSRGLVCYQNYSLWQTMGY